MSKKELEDMKKQWMEEMKANMKNNEKVIYWSIMLIHQLPIYKLSANQYTSTYTAYQHTSIPSYQYTSIPVYQYNSMLNTIII